MGPLDEGARDHGAVLQHVLEVHEVAVVHVLGIIVRVVEVDDALLMCLDDVLGQEDAVGQVAADLARHVVALRGVDDGVLVAVLLLGLLVVALDEAEDLVVGGVAGALEALHVAVGDVVAGDLVGTGGHDLVLDQVLDLLDRHRVAAGGAGVLDLAGDAVDLLGGKLVVGGDHSVGLAHRFDDLLHVEGDLGTVTLDDLHTSPLLYLPVLPSDSNGPHGPQSITPSSSPRGRCESA